LLTPENSWLYKAKRTRNSSGPAFHAGENIGPYNTLGEYAFDYITLAAIPNFHLPQKYRRLQVAMG